MQLYRFPPPAVLFVCIVNCIILQFCVNQQKKSVLTNIVFLSEKRVLKPKCAPSFQTANFLLALTLPLTCTSNLHLVRHRRQKAHISCVQSSCWHYGHWLCCQAWLYIGSPSGPCKHSSSRFSASHSDGCPGNRRATTLWSFQEPSFLTALGFMTRLLLVIHILSYSASTAIWTDRFIGGRAHTHSCTHMLTNRADCYTQRSNPPLQRDKKRLLNARPVEMLNITKKNATKHARAGYR